VAASYLLGTAWVAGVVAVYRRLLATEARERGVSRIRSGA
jgi:hypothetical protein